AHGSLGPRLHGMGQDVNAERRVALRARRGPREVLEYLRHHDDRRHAGALTDDRVVDTPRRARPSRSETDDRRVDAMREGGHLRALLLGPADAGLGIEDHDVPHAELRASEALDLVRRLPPGTPGVIDADAQHAASEGGDARRERSGLGRAERNGRADLDGAHGRQVPRSTRRRQASSAAPRRTNTTVVRGGGSGSASVCAPSGSGPITGSASRASNATADPSRASDVQASGSVSSYRRSAMVRSSATTPSRSSSTFVLANSSIGQPLFQQGQAYAR